MKKILALVLAFALCFTAVAGCITTSAEDVKPTISIEVDEVASNGGATSFTVSGKDYGTVAAQQLVVTIAKDVTFNSIFDGETPLVGATGEQEYDEEGNPIEPDYYVEKDKDGNTIVKLVSVFNIGSVNRDSFSFTFNVTVPANDGETDATYNVKADVTAGNIDEQYVIIESASADITVKAPVVEPAEPEIDANVTITPNLYYSDKIGILFYVKPDTMTGYSDYYIDTTFTKYDSNYMSYTATKRFNPEDKTMQEGSTNHYFYFTEQAAYEITNKILFRINLLDANGVVVAYNTLELSIAEKALADMDKYTKYGDLAREACVSFIDMVNYAAAAQTYFSGFAQYADSDLAKAPLANEGFEKYQDAYASNYEIDRNTLNKTSESTSNITPMLVIQSSNAVLYKFSGLDSYNVENLRLHVSYTSSYKDDNGDPIVVTEVAPLKWDADASAYVVTFSNVALYDLQKTVTAELKNGDEVIGTSNYCLEKHIDTYLGYASYPTLASLADLGECILYFARSAYNSLF